jgi:hypothetical protein
MLIQRGLLPRKGNKIETAYNYQGFNPLPHGSLFRTSPHGPEKTTRPHQRGPTNIRLSNPGPTRDEPTPKAPRQDMAEVGGDVPDLSMASGSGSPALSMEIVGGSSPSGDVSMAEEEVADASQSVNPSLLAERIEEVQRKEADRARARSLVRVAASFLGV